MEILLLASAIAVVILFVILHIRDKRRFERQCDIEDAQLDEMLKETMRKIRAKYTGPPQDR